MARIITFPATLADPPAPLQLTLEPFNPPVDAGPDATLEQRFAAFHEANPHVYRELVILARDLVAHGRTRISVGMLFEVLRWSSLRTATGDDDYKLNNSYRSRYARLIVDTCPDLATVFELRKLTAE